MPKDHLLCDKTEIIATQLMGNQWRQVSARADRIKSIRFDYVDTRKLLLFKGRDERITVEVSGGMPVTFLRSAEKGYFDEYKERLREFAYNNKITFHNDVVSQTV